MSTVVDSENVEVYGPYARTDHLASTNIRHSYKPDSHLVSFDEYFLMYLFVWSDVLWGSELPTFGDLLEYYETHTTNKFTYEESHRSKWEAESARLRRFREDLPAVRSLLRSTPTLMIFDDHDVTDDWRLNEAWIVDVIGMELGKQIELNALLAYILAQASGNDALQFTPLIDEVFQDVDVAGWRERGVGKGRGLANVLGWQDLKLNQSKIRFHYRVDLPAIHVVVLDTRTRRGYDQGEYASLIATEHIVEQIGQPGTRMPMLLVSPAPMFGHVLVEELQAWMTGHPGVNHWWYEDGISHIPDDKFDPVLNVDAESWALEQWSRIFFLRELFKSWKDAPFYVVLSGDVHYAYAQTIAFMDRQPSKLVQLTSSAILNHESTADYLKYLRDDLQTLKGSEYLKKLILHVEAEFKYTVEMHAATVEKTATGATGFLGLLRGLSELTPLEIAKNALRSLDTYVWGDSNCGLIAFPQAGRLTHTLITRSMGDPAHVTWTIPV